MDFLNILVLSIVQGITEFLPISSSGHLILLPKFMSWSDQGLGIDIAMHVGTLLAVVLYFYKDSLGLLKGFADFTVQKNSPQEHLFLNVCIATIPVVILGFFLKSMVENEFRQALLVAAMSIIFGVVLFFADKKADENKKQLDGMTMKDALLIGLAQSIALVPGVSRSGITMTAALFLGYSRTDSAKFSLVLSIPTTLAAGILVAYSIYKVGSNVQTTEILLAGALSFIFAFLTIWAMMCWLKSFSFKPFVIYRILLGLIIFMLYW